MFDATIATQMVTLPVPIDNAIEDTEFIDLTLTSVDSAVMLNPATARINIKDTESELLFAMVHFHCCAHSLFTSNGNNRS